MDWRPLTRSALRGHQRRCILIVRSDGVGYFGKIEIAFEHCVVLKNNGFSQNIFFDRSWQFRFVDLPQPRSPKLADRRLPLENPDG